MTAKKQLILEAATILFAEKGFKDTSIAEIAAMTESAEGTIFYHFSNKTELLVSILEYVKNGILEEFEAFALEHRFAGGEEMVDAVIAFYLYLASHREQWILLLHRHFPYELARENPRCRIQLEAIYNTLIDLFEEGIRRGQAEGTMRALSPRKTALVLFSLVNGLTWLKFHDLYDAASLHKDMLDACRRIVLVQDREKTGE
jgi:AcrR family transcriptional regulator